MIITVSGLAGTGTTSVCQRLKEDLSFEYIYAGAIFRKEAELYGKSIEEFCQHLEENPELDKAIDKKVIEFAREHDNTILEGRLAAWMAYQENLPALKILLTAPLEISAERVASRDLYLRSKEEAKKRVQERDERDKERYKKLYNINLADNSIYDLIIDTSDKTIEEEVEIIKKAVLEFKQNNKN
jgi:cytidylate kinase